LALFDSDKISTNQKLEREAGRRSDGYVGTETLKLSEGVARVVLNLRRYRSSKERVTSSVDGVEGGGCGMRVKSCCDAGETMSHFGRSFHNRTENNWIVN
jgi:hypothetical protein